MAKIFIGISLLVMLATAGVAFKAKGNIDQLQTKLGEIKSRVQSAEVAAKTAKSDADKAQKDAKDAADKADAATQQLAAKAKEAADAVAAKSELQLLVDQKDKELAVAKQAAIDATGKPPAPVDDSKLTELQTKLQNAEKERDEAKQVTESQSGHVKDVEAKLAAAETKERKREQKFGVAGLQGRILAVNGGWNFVVLSVGDKQGVAINAPLLVVRGNEPIARLRITSVEPSTSIADVLPGSLRRGVTVQPGDTVIFEGGRAAPDQSASKPAADAPATATVPPLPQ